MFRFLSNAIDLFIRLWFSPCCPICQECLTSQTLCGSCCPIVPISGNLCEHCGLQVEKNRIFCGACEDQTDYPLDRIRSSLWFTEEAKVIMHLVKFQNRFEWLQVFEEYLKVSNFPYSGEGFTCVPVPIHNKKFINRGFNQSEIIVSWIAQKFLWDISLGLEKVKETEPQSVLNRDERRTNLVSAFDWNSKFKMPEKVILVDDILTTGETLKACAKVMKAHGAKEVYGWTVFRAKPLKDLSLKGF